MISENELFVGNGEEQLSDQREENAALWIKHFKEKDWILDEGKSIIICNRETNVSVRSISDAFWTFAIQFQLGFFDESLQCDLNHYYFVNVTDEIWLYI